MQKENLKSLLKQLHVGLLDTEQIDDEVKTLLQGLSEDIHQVLSTDDTPDDPIFSALSERSQAMSARFAAKHPKLEPVLRELGDMLEKMGV
jgi:predicted nucleotide-binding protein